VISFLTHLNGALAATLLCALLFVDEVGVPLPFAPNEVLLLLGGLLIATGVLEPLVFVPLALLSMTAGMLTGFTWARKLGGRRLRDLAAKIDAEDGYEKAVRRVRSAGGGGLALWRLVPGVRVYTTLAAGASGMPLRRFLVGAMPALVVWLGALVTVGDLVGRPAEAVISRVDNIILTGALLIVLGFGSFVVVRRVPRGRIEEDHMTGVPRSPRVVLALAVDLGIVAATIAGVDSIAGHFLALLRELNGVAILSVVLVVSYLAVARHRAGATLGEGLFAVDYRALVGMGRAADMEVRGRAAKRRRRSVTRRAATSRAGSRRR
jgi:membrane protein DedA with SNARE-associated domain